MSSGRAWLTDAAAWTFVALLLGCAAASPPPGNDQYCAQLFDQLDAYDFLPMPTGPAFDFRQMQIARIQQARCLTFTRNLVDLEAKAGQVADREAPSGPVLRRPAAVQAGVVTNDQDAGRAIAFFNRLGYRARSVGAPGLGARVYVEAGTLGEIETIVRLARGAGFIGPYPSDFEPKTFLADRDEVMVTGAWAGKVRATGKPFQARWAMRWVIRDGKVASYEGFEDTAIVAAAFRD